MSASAGSGEIRAPVPRDSAAAHRARIDRTETPSEVRWVLRPDIGAAVTGPVARHPGPGPPRRTPSRADTCARREKRENRSGPDDECTRDRRAPRGAPAGPDRCRRTDRPAYPREMSMPTTLGSIRRLLLTPSLEKVTFAGRGFPVPPSAYPAAGGRPAGGGLRFRVGDRRPRPGGANVAAAAGRPRAARVSPTRARRWPSPSGTRWPAGAATGPGTCCPAPASGTSSWPTSGSASRWPGCPGRCGRRCCPI